MCAALQTRFSKPRETSSIRLFGYPRQVPTSKWAILGRSLGGRMEHSQLGLLDAAFEQPPAQKVATPQTPLVDPKKRLDSCNYFCERGSLLQHPGLPTLPTFTPTRVTNHCQLRRRSRPQKQEGPDTGISSATNVNVENTPQKCKSNRQRNRAENSVLLRALQKLKEFTCDKTHDVAQTQV